jgi:hypothetical protein
MKTTSRWVSLLIAVAVCGAFASVNASPARAEEKVTTVTKTVTKGPKLTKAGWWIRVHPEKTSATTIWFKIGMEKKGSNLWRTWKPGEALEFDVPAEFLNAAKLYIHGTTDPHNRHAMFCVFYMDHAVREFHFDGTVDHNMKPSDTDFLHKCKP